MQQPDLARRVLSIAAISFVTIVPCRAHAQLAEAEAMFNDGNRLMAAGQIGQACDAFEASNKLEQRAGTLIRLGECREQNHQLASAWSAYKDALTRVKDPYKRDIALAKAAELEPKLSYLTVSIPDDSRVEGLQLARNGKALDPVLWNRAVPVDGGQYIIAGRAPGHEEWQTTVEVPIEHGKVTVDVPKFKEIAKLITPAPTVTNQVDAADEARDRPAGMFTTKRKIAIGVAGAGAVSLIAGIFLGVSAKGKNNDAYALCPDPQTPCAGADQATKLTQSAHSLAIEADVAFGIAAAAAIGAGVLWFTGAPETTPPRVSVVPAVTPGQAGIALVGRF